MGAKAKGKRQKAKETKNGSLGRCINCHLLVRSAWQILNS
jgi:hypothetical protein